MRGTGLVGVATSQFHDVDVTTTGTTQGSSSSVLKKPGACILFRSSSASARPTTQLPKTPTRQNTTVNRTACQNAGLCRAAWKFCSPTYSPGLTRLPLCTDWNTEYIAG